MPRQHQTTRPVAIYPEYFQVLAVRGLETQELEDEATQNAATSDAQLAVDRNPAPFLNDGRLSDIASEATTSSFILATSSDELPAEDVYEPDPAAVELFLPEADRPSLPADAIAVYAPWHFYGDHWGIYVNERLLGGFAEALARLTNTPLRQIAPLAHHQVLEHEWVHFAFEIAGTEIEDAVGASRYREYARYGYGNPDPSLSLGPLEEIVASAAEVVFARHGRGGFKNLRPKGYTEAVGTLLDACPPGYSDWRLMTTRREEVLRGVMSRIAGRPMKTHRWGEADASEKDQVPLHWVGDPAKAPFFGALPKGAGPPSIRRFEKWLRRKVRADIVEGRGDHRKATVPGLPHPIDYDTGAGFLLPPEAKQFSAALGLSHIMDLYEHVRDMKPPQILAAHSN